MRGGLDKAKLHSSLNSADRDPHKSVYSNYFRKNKLKKWKWNFFGLLDSLPE